LEVTMQNGEQAIRDLVATWLSASKAGDTEKVLSLMADDVVFLRAGQPPMRGKDAFAAAQGWNQDFDLAASHEIQEVRVFGDWAYCWNRLEIALTPKAGGETVWHKGDVLSVLQKQAGGWVIVRDANLLTAAG
jgi:uncharacterized protein (TIGR02246 family)